MKNEQIRTQFLSAEYMIHTGEGLFDWFFEQFRMTPARRLRDWRKENNMNQGDVAKIGPFRERSIVSRMENGEILDVSWIACAVLNLLSGHNRRVTAKNTKIQKAFDFYYKQFSDFFLIYDHECRELMKGTFFAGHDLRKKVNRALAREMEKLTGMTPAEWHRFFYLKPEGSGLYYPTSDQYRMIFLIDRLVQIGEIEDPFLCVAEGASKLSSELAMRKARLAAGLSVIQAAAAFSVSPGYWLRMEMSNGFSSEERLLKKLVLATLRDKEKTKGIVEKARSQPRAQLIRERYKAEGDRLFPYQGARGIQDWDLCFFAEGGVPFKKSSSERSSYKKLFKDSPEERKTARRKSLSLWEKAVNGSP